MIRDEERLVIALMQVENLLKISENNPYGKYLQSHLYPVRCELERQLNNLSIVNTNKESVTDQ